MILSKTMIGPSHNISQLLKIKIRNSYHGSSDVCSICIRNIKSRLKNTKKRLIKISTENEQLVNLNLRFIYYCHRLLIPDLAKLYFSQLFIQSLMQLLKCSHLGKYNYYINSFIQYYKTIDFVFLRLIVILYGMAQVNFASQCSITHHIHSMKCKNCQTSLCRTGIGQTLWMAPTDMKVPSVFLIFLRKKN